MTEKHQDYLAFVQRAPIVTVGELKPGDGFMLVDDALSDYESAKGWVKLDKAMVCCNGLECKVFPDETLVIQVAVRPQPLVTSMTVESERQRIFEEEGDES